MIIEMPKEELAYKNEKISHCIYLNSHGTVYKDCEKSPNVPDFLEDRILYVSSMPIINGYTRPINVLADNNHIYGYEMEYLKDYEPLKTFIGNLPKDENISFLKKKIALLNLLKCLRQINERYIIGDINLNNIMINKQGDIKIIDWENGMPKDTQLPILSYFNPLYLSNTATQADSMKMFICALSLLYETNLEDKCLDFSFSDLYDFAISLNMHHEIKKFLDDWSYIYMTKSNSVIYFDEYLKKMAFLKSSNIKRVRRQAPLYGFNY